MKQNLLCSFLLFLAVSAMAQNVGIGTTNPNASAKLDIESGNSGILIPRMTSGQRKNIGSPAKGLLVFDTDKSGFLYFDGNKWVSLAGTNEFDQPAVSVTAPLGDTTLRFGNHVSIDSNYAAISATETTNNNNNFREVVYIFQKQADGQWTIHTKLQAPGSATSTQYGHSTDLCGDYLIVGAPTYTNSQGIASGVAFVYKRTGNAWNLEATLERASSVAGEYFGYDVAIDVDESGIVRAVIGAPRRPGSGGISAAGQVVVFLKNINNYWVFEQNVTPSNLNSNDQAGISVDIDEDLIVFGAPFANYTFENGDISYERGRLYIYRRINNLWVQEFSLLGSTDHTAFGYSVSVHNGRVAASAPFFSASSSYFGTVSVFKKVNDNWMSNSLFCPQELRSLGYARYGIAIALYGDKLLVSASAGINNLDYNDHQGHRPGSSFLYQLTEFAWSYSFDFSLLKTFSSGRPQNNDLFSQSVSIGRGSYIVSNHTFNGPVRSTQGEVQFGSVN